MTYASKRDQQREDRLFLLVSNSYSEFELKVVSIFSSDSCKDTISIFIKMSSSYAAGA